MRSPELGPRSPESTQELDPTTQESVDLKIFGLTLEQWELLDVERQIGQIQDFRFRRLQITMDEFQNGGVTNPQFIDAMIKRLETDDLFNNLKFLQFLLSDPENPQCFQGGLYL